MGLDAMLVNLGEVRNRGFELSIGWNDRINKNFSYFVTGNFSYLKNWVSDIGVKNEDGTPGVWTDFSQPRQYTVISGNRQVKKTYTVTITLQGE